jgi:glycosidase
MTTRGIPLVYYGDEIAMRGGDDPDNRRDFPARAFEASGRTAEEQTVWEHVRRLARFRAQTPALRTGELRHLYADDSVYVYARGTVVIAINNMDVQATGLRDALGLCAAPEAGKVRVPARTGCIFH